MSARAGAAAALLASIAAALCAGVVGAADTDASRWWAHVRFLADDSLEGREAGTPGYRRAAEYVAERLRRAGLEPAFSGQFVQPVALKTRQIDESRSSLALVRAGRAEPLMLGEDANFSLRIDPAPAVDAPLVFAGHGLDIPDARINDLDGLDLRGAVAVYFSTTPASLPGPLQAHFGSNAERWRMLRAAGAIGTIAIPGAGRLEVPWSRSTLARLQPQMSLADPSLDEYPGQQLAVTMNPDKAGVLFAGSGHTLSELVELDQAGQPLPRFTLPARVKATIAVNRSTIESPNVAAILRGADPNLRDEAVVAVGASRSRRRRRPGRRRPDLQRRDGQRVGRGDDSGSRRAASRVGLRGRRDRLSSSRSPPRNWASWARGISSRTRRRASGSSPTSTRTCSCRSSR